MNLKEAAEKFLSHLEHISRFLTSKGVSYSFESLSEDWPEIQDVLKRIPDGFVWINKPAIVSGEDFTYRAQVLCSFPKTSGKVRYIVEDNGRIFVQRESQIKFLSREEVLRG